MSEQRNVILAVVISLAIMLGFQLLMPGQPPPLPVDQQVTLGTTGGPGPQPGAVPAQPVPAVGIPPTTAAPTPAPVVTDASARVPISTPSLHGSISLIGGRVDSLTLVNYRETPKPDSDEIVVLSPPGSGQPYYADFGWVPATGQTVELPGATTRWTADGGELAVGKPLTLRWTNAAGLTFLRTFAVDDRFMFTVTQRVQNGGADPVTLMPFAAVYRFGTPVTQGMYILHEGAVGVMDGTLRERDYEELKEDGKALKEQTTGGWAGITDKYWLVALAPQPDQQATMRFLYQNLVGTDVYQVDHVGQPLTAAPGSAIETSSYLFAGAKEAAALTHYADTLGIEMFDYAIDFGYFNFLTKPFFHALTFLHGVIGNFGIAILVFTVIIKLLVFPLANKSYTAMSKMKKLQPEMKKVQERFVDDRMRMNQEVMALYKREKVNPAAGCLPILIQIPVFFALYKVLFVTIEMRHAPFFGWIQDLSAPDPTSIFNLFGLVPWTPPSMLMIGAWPLIMGVTMWLQQKLNPQPTDPIQAKMFALFPFVFTVMLAQFAAGLVIYWAWNNILSIIQQWVIMKRMGVSVNEPTT